MEYLEYQLAAERVTRMTVNARVAGGVEEMACHGEESKTLERRRAG